MYCQDLPFSLSYPVSLTLKFIPFPKKIHELPGTLHTDFRNLTWQECNCLFSALGFSQGTVVLIWLSNRKWR